ncbi:uncharacterized protein LOC119330896 isoform X4 [Triticum dicoccoides]|uniref:uncharacterized protein LOC119330896 isoform X4 n=1 Tax=Triticum dicoccoides TaxID=85692 RepID=UPI00188EE337|nr:uncharacterized protein LOC119330896 isoform X4 [Triticum dicoccoides]
MHTHPRPTHAHTPTSHWIPSLSSSSIPFLHPMPPPDSGDPRGEPRLGTGGGAPRGGPSSVELLLLRAQRRRRGQDGRSPSRYINHLKPARLGDCIEAKANPIRTSCWTQCIGSGRRWGSPAACSGAPSPSSAPSGLPYGVGGRAAAAANQSDDDGVREAMVIMLMA